MNLLKSIFKFKCPRCRVGNLFLNNNPYILRDLNKMHERCDNCNLKFSIEPGFFQCAAYVSYGLQVLSSLNVFNGFFLVNQYSLAKHSFYTTFYCHTCNSL